MTREADIDVAIVGAGISGISMAAHLRTMCPGTRFTLFERREAIGGTWDLFRYPGIRSDSDLHTFGYEFKPWRDEDDCGNDVCPGVTTHVAPPVSMAHRHQHGRGDCDVDPVVVPEEKGHRRPCTQG